MFEQIDWNTLLVPSVSLVEVFLRGTFVYLLLFFIFRFLRREAGAIGIGDVLVVVLIADAAQNAMSSDYKSITEGALLVGTIAFWDYALEWLGYRYESLGRLLRPKPLLLIKDGELQRRNLRHEMITPEELIGQLRQHGVEDPEQVKQCFLESGGRISVVKAGATGARRRKS